MRYKIPKKSKYINIYFKTEYNAATSNYRILILRLLKIPIKKRVNLYVEANQGAEMCIQHFPHMTCSGSAPLAINVTPFWPRQLPDCGTVLRTSLQRWQGTLKDNGNVRFAWFGNIYNIDLGIAIYGIFFEKEVNICSPFVFEKANRDVLN